MQSVGIVPESGEVLTHHHQVRAASGGALAPERPRAHWSGPEVYGMKHEGSVMDKVVQGECLKYRGMTKLYKIASKIVQNRTY